MEQMKYENIFHSNFKFFTTSLYSYDLKPVCKAGKYATGFGDKIISYASSL